MAISAVQAYVGLLQNCDPAHAARILRRYMGWNWPHVDYAPYRHNAPIIVREMADSSLWERFSSTSPIAQREVAAHYLFRAAMQQSGPARALLVEHAQSLVREIIKLCLRD